jgi:hypothetical protein
MSIKARLVKRLHILESSNDASFKDFTSQNYSREEAEDALYHTIGPLTDSPRWSSNWTSDGPPVSGFKPGGPAPKWTQDEIAMAYAGDPNMLWERTGHPKSPRSGKGSPLYRAARKIARTYNKGNDRSFIDDLFSLGFVALTQAMQAGRDESRSPFISYVSRYVKGAMENGLGSDQPTLMAAGEKSTYYAAPGGEFRKRVPSKPTRKPGESRESYDARVRNWEEQSTRFIQIEAVGVAGLLKMKNPSEVRRAASIVKGKYRNERSTDLHVDNPFGRFSTPYYQMAMEYADALEDGDETEIDKVRSKLFNLQGEIEDSMIYLGGASTGIGQAIDTPDRAGGRTRDPNYTKGDDGDDFHLKISSMDASKGDETGTMAMNIPGSSADEEFDSVENREIIKKVLEIALKHDLSKVLASSRKYQAMATDLGAKKGKIGGPLSPNEFRYVIRSMGGIAYSYPGKGTVRAAADTIPRDTKGWIATNEDPEIEPIPGGGLWRSIWTRNGYKSIGATEIAAEMIDEVKEFQRLGIETGRAPSMAKTTVQNALKAGQIKIKLISDIYADQLGIRRQDMSESLFRASIIQECRSMDRFDITIIAEAARKIAQIISRSIEEPHVTMLPMPGPKRSMMMRPIGTMSSIEL